MSEILIDIHNHTTFSDGCLTPLELKSLAEKRGITLGISDHLDYYHNMDTEDKFDDYLRTLDRLGIMKGVELGLLESIPVSETQLSRLDYIIGGLHRLVIQGDEVEFWGEKRFEGDADKFMDNLVDGLIRGVGEYPIDVLAHPTYVPGYITCDTEISKLWTVERMRALIGTCVEHSVAIEINNHWEVPHSAFIKAALGMGAMFSIGSDGHSERSCLKIEYPLKVIERFSIPGDRIFTPKRAVKRLLRFV